MLNKKVEKALNAQLNAEMYSSYLYLSMAAYCEAKNLPGFGHWMNIQAQEELFHAMKFYDFINERGGRVTLTKIDGPMTTWPSPVKMFDHVYKHEVKVTGLINKLVDLAIKEKDHATNNFLQWFVKEQVEEEATASDVLGRLKLIGKNSNGLLMYDRELAQRLPLFTFPVKSGE
jgi:ferritin